MLKVSHLLLILPLHPCILSFALVLPVDVLFEKAVQPTVLVHDFVIVVLAEEVHEVTADLQDAAIRERVHFLVGLG